MLEIIISVLLVSLIAAALAAVLVLSERIIANYGACTVTINDEKQLTVKGGGSLLGALVAEKIFIPSACGGKGTCGYCKVKVLDGAGPLLPTEEPFLEPAERSDNVRLSCQVKIRRDMAIRIPEELFNIREFTCHVTKITDLTHDMKEFRFELLEPAEIKYTPGQYVQLKTEPYEDVTEEVYRAYSISSNPAEPNTLELVIRLVPGGICTTWCHKHLAEGDTVRMNGPYGEFYLRDTDAPIVFIAGGSGVAPIKCILHHMENNKIDREAVFYFGANLVKELCYQDLMKHFEDVLPRFKFVPVVARPEADAGWSGQTGLVTEALGRNLPDASQHEAYLCGSPGMIDASIAVLKKLGMPDDKIYYDKFA